MSAPAPSNPCLQDAKSPCPGFEEFGTAIAAFVDRCSLPVFAADSNRQFAIGTGTLLGIRNSTFLVTAAHVIEQAGRTPLALPLDRTFKSIQTLGAVEILRAARSEHDVAVVALKDREIVRRLASSWTILTPQNIAAPRWGKLFFVHGYRTAESFADKGLTPPGERVAFVTIPLAEPAPVPAVGDPADPQNDLFLELRDESVFPDGVKLLTPNFKGVSGGTVWEFSPTDESGAWTAEKQLRCVAIQSGQLPGKYLRAKRLHLLWSAFRWYDPRIAGAFRSALTRSIPVHLRQPQPRAFSIKRTKGERVN